jgi:endo-1,4-beta-D-glucanase Y
MKATKNLLSPDSPEINIWIEMNEMKKSITYIEKEFEKMLDRNLKAKLAEKNKSIISNENSK